MAGIDKSRAGRPCEEIDGRVNAFLDRPLEGEWPCLRLDAAYLKVREVGRIVSVAATIAVVVDAEGRRGIVGLHLGPSEAVLLERNDVYGPPSPCKGLSELPAGTPALAVVYPASTRGRRP